jgi:hypothetical protein
MKYNVLFLLLTIVVLLPVFSQTVSKKSNRPHIVLIMADDLGYSDLWCNGSKIKTTNLYKLASKGLRFRTIYNMAKCNPSRPSLLTGFYNWGDGVLPIATFAKKMRVLVGLWRGKSILIVGCQSIVMGITFR